LGKALPDRGLNTLVLRFTAPFRSGRAAWATVLAMAVSFGLCFAETPLDTKRSGLISKERQGAVRASLVGDKTRCSR